MNSVRLSAVTAVAALAVSPLRAQSPAATSQPPVTDTAPARVTVALVQELPIPNARAVIVRRAYGRGQVILLREADVSASTLGFALAVVKSGRQGHFDGARDELTAITNVVLSQPLSGAVRQRLEQQVQELRVAGRRPIDGFGSPRAIDVTLPARRPS